MLMGRAQSAAAARASASVAAVTVSRFQASATASAAAPTAIEPFAWTPMTGDSAGSGGFLSCAACSGGDEGGPPGNDESRRTPSDEVRNCEAAGQRRQSEWPLSDNRLPRRIGEKRHAGGGEADPDADFG